MKQPPPSSPLFLFTIFFFSSSSTSLFFKLPHSRLCLPPPKMLQSPIQHLPQREHVKCHKVHFNELPHVAPSSPCLIGWIRSRRLPRCRPGPPPRLLRSGVNYLTLTPIPVAATSSKSVSRLSNGRRDLNPLTSTSKASLLALINWRYLIVQFHMKIKSITSLEVSDDYKRVIDQIEGCDKLQAMVSDSSVLVTANAGGDIKAFSNLWHSWPHVLGDALSFKRMAVAVALNHRAAAIRHLLWHHGGEEVTIADGLGLPISHTGSALLPTPSRSLALKDIFYVPNVSENLISVYRMCNANKVSVEFFLAHFQVKDLSTGARLLKGRTRNELYEWPVNLNPITILTASPSPKTDLPSWHHRLGHHALPILKAIVSHFQLPLSNSIPKQCKQDSEPAMVSLLPPVEQIPPSKNAQKEQLKEQGYEVQKDEKGTREKSY
ncbi:hypothetical protein ISN44_As09g007010 [Arabidopsis suecica]|uniref:GAG-pre-integrase domain-containing protein n=1 Tax=Arabidopsis suecica TaxID=45249 RepID=A0A8T2AFT2_ARASU|nr:hypothetical protein ISN44_As09g007010 [Arabidopsis suecica]